MPNCGEDKRKISPFHYLRILSLQFADNNENNIIVFIDLVLKNVGRNEFSINPSECCLSFIISYILNELYPQYLNIEMSQ